MIRILLGFVLYGIVAGSALAATVQWSMINVNSRAQQGDAHLLKFSSGKVFLIDTGMEGEGLLDYLRSIGIKRLDKIIITHPHKDHYSALTSLADSDIKIGEILMNWPDERNCVDEKPWGCDPDHVFAFQRQVREKKLPLRPVKAGEILFSHGSTRLKVLYAYDGVNTPVGRTDINGMSLILRLEHGKTRVLFTGDLSPKIGEYLAKSGKGLKADILKVPHHGGEGVPPNAFFDRVGAKLALVPAPKSLWLGERCKRLKSYFEAKRIPIYVNGIHGHVIVDINEKSYAVKIEEKYGHQLQ